MNRRSKSGSLRTSRPSSRTPAEDPGLQLQSSDKAELARVPHEADNQTDPTGTERTRQDPIPVAPRVETLNLFPISVWDEPMGLAQNGMSDAYQIHAQGYPRQNSRKMQPLLSSGSQFGPVISTNSRKAIARILSVFLDRFFRPQ